MKNLLFILLFLLSGAAIYAQPKMELLTKEHDFGTIKQADGKVTYNFIVTNTGDSALVIMNVVPSCGCTTPEWTKSPIPPKGQGKITAIYDAGTYPGAFNKTLTIHSNSKPEPVMLTIKGEVTPKEKTVEELFQWPLGTVRFETNHLAFTNVKKNEIKIRVMPIINTGTEPVKIEFTGVPAHLALKANPETLKPGQKGLIEGTYDATKNPGWGTVSDMIKVKLNGVEQANAYYYVSANLVEDFSKLTKEEVDNAPVFKIAATTVDIGRMDSASTRDVEFKYTNDGKRDLLIRNVKSQCGCTAVQQGSTTIKPGESSSIKATFNAGSYSPQKITKAIYVYTNDPKNSEVILILNGEIVKKTGPK
jgi:hypothetical protein